MFFNDSPYFVIPYIIIAVKITNYTLDEKLNGK